uniref:WD_REPEATS_REGION domain-containing protein n=1 Tax=Rhabditophanes sp. KR3021 TaxID=114890 RepID=A0AC35TIX8_9BILA
MVLTTKLLQFKCDQRNVRAVRFNTDGRYAITCGSDKTIKLWNPYTGLHLNTYSGEVGDILDACSSNDNSLILSGGVGKVLMLFNVETKKNTRRWQGHFNQINAVAFNEEATVAFSASQDGTVRSYDMKTHSKNPIQVFDEANDGILSLDIKENEIATGCADGTFRIYDLRKGAMSIDHVDVPVTNVQLTEDNQCILVGTLNSHINLFDKLNGESLACYDKHINKQYKIECGMLVSGNEILTGSEDGNAYLYDMLSGNIVGSLDHKEFSSYVHSVACHPKEMKAMTGAKDVVCVWEFVK